MAHQILTRAELYEFLQSSAMVLESDFYISIDGEELTSDDNRVICTAFDMPNLGIKIGTDNALFGFVGANYSTQDCSMEIVTPVAPIVNGWGIESASVIHQAYSKQFTEQGTLRLIPTAKRPSVAFYVMINGMPYRWLLLEGCYFSQPIPSASSSSSKISRWKFTVSYQRYTLY